MRVRQWLLLPLLVVLASGLLSVACGGSGNERAPPDLSKIPTATPPNPLPEPVIVGETSPALQGETYTVKDGDSPTSIAEQFDTTAEAIMEANGITDPTQLEVGQQLIIPGAAPEDGEALGATTAPPSTAEPSTPVEPETLVDGQVYIVQSGDIPETIAEQFGISAEALMEANGITDPTSLEVGQELIIPSPAPTATLEPATP